MRDAGYDVLHTLDLTFGNSTTDASINQLSVDQQWVVVTKDADFVHSFWLHQRPYKLLLISTGNISNPDLLILVEQLLPILAEAFAIHDFIEIDQRLWLSTANTQAFRWDLKTA